MFSQEAPKIWEAGIATSVRSLFHRSLLPSQARRYEQVCVTAGSSWFIALGTYAFGPCVDKMAAVET